jgi:F-box interacting protein
MVDETAAATERRSKMRLRNQLPPELVWEIMVRLPVKSLLRFRCVCKAWRDRISGDAEFRGAHLRAQTPCLFAWSSTEENRRNMVTTSSLYVSESEESAALQNTMVLPLEEQRPCFAHCHGLVLMPTETVVRVFNPATRRVLTLPCSSNGVAPPTFCFQAFLTHQLFGIGHDPLSNTYKVVRFFLSTLDLLPTDYNFGVDVFTIGIDQQWRQTTAQPPYPAHMGRNPAFFKGSLFWTIDENRLSKGESAPGFVRFRLEDESFSVTPPPPRCRGLIYETSYLAELRGELSVAHAGAQYDSIEIWMCDQVDTNQPQWNKRYIFSTFCLDNDLLFQTTMYSLCRDFLVRQVLKDIVGVDGLLRYHHIESLIPYIPSLVPL